MNRYSMLLALLRPQTVARAAETAQPDPSPLPPRTAADELPPYRVRPWLSDGLGYGKHNETLTLVPKSKV